MHEWAMGHSVIIIIQFSRSMIVISSSCPIEIQSGLIIIIRQFDRITSLSPSSSTKGELGLSGPGSTFTRFGSTRRGCSFRSGFLGGRAGLFDRDDFFRIITFVV
jgi:hypothetical protein